MRCSICSLLLFFALTGAVQAADPNMKEGLWEITMKMDMPGMPAGMKPQIVQQCVTRNDLKDPRKATPGGDATNGRCQVSDYKMQGNTATWNMVCKGEEEMTGTASITYSGTSYVGVNKMTMKRRGQVQTMTVHYSGRHLGDCRK